jgi:hypothetical protein
MYFLQKLTQGREDENKGSYNTRTKREAMRLDSTERIVSIVFCIFVKFLSSFIKRTAKTLAFN